MKRIRRFKTEKEFIAEYSGNYRYTVPGTWPESMDKYFGQPIKIKLLNNRNIYEGWTITKGMLTTKRLPKYLSDGTIAKAGMKVSWLAESRIRPAVIYKVYLYSLNQFVLGFPEEMDYVEIYCHCIDCLEKNWVKFPRTVPLKELKKYQK